MAWSARDRSALLFTLSRILLVSEGNMIQRLMGSLDESFVALTLANCLDPRAVGVPI
jgi:hypothetical protein